MKLSKLQEFTEKERMDIILKFREAFPGKEREEFLKEMSNEDINFLIYCMDNIYGKIAYSKYLKKEKESLQ